MKAIMTVLVVATIIGSGCARPEWMAPSSPTRAIYYVSSSGDDANDGSTTKPWRTINKVNATTLSPGDTVALEGGAQFHGHLLITQSGTSNEPIQITSYSSASGDRGVRDPRKSLRRRRVQQYLHDGFRNEARPLPGRRRRSP